MAGILIAVGVLLLGRNMGIISPDIFHIFVSWQMLLIVIGINLLTKKQFVGSILLVATGIYFLLPRLNFFNDTFSTIFWPAILIIAGLLIITSRGKSKCNHHKHFQTKSINHTTEDGFVHIDNSFGSIQQVVTDEIFKGGSIHNSFGSVELDLRRTSLLPGTTYLDINMSFAGTEIYAPSNWIIKSELQTSLGGYEDSRISGLNPTDTDKVLVLRGSVSFSGIEVKS